MACEFPYGRLDCELLYPYTLLYFIDMPINIRLQIYVTQLEDVCWCKVYCPHALAEGKQSTRIGEKTLEFSSTVLSTLSPYLQEYSTCQQVIAPGGSGDTICPQPPPIAVRLAADLRPSADGSAVRTSLVASQLQAASVPIA